MISANASIEDKSLWDVAAVIGISLILVHGLSYVIVEYGIFGGNSEYEEPPTDSSDSELAMTGTAPTAYLNDVEFRLYMGFVFYMTVFLTGRLDKPVPILSYHL